MLEDKLKEVSILERLRQNVTIYGAALALTAAPLMYGCESSVENKCSSDGDCKNGYICEEKCNSYDCSPDPCKGKYCAEGKVYANSCTQTTCSNICVEKSLNK